MSPLPPWLERFASHTGIGALVDHTLLKPEATEADILRLCEEASRFGFAAVCVNGQWVATAVAALRGSAVAIAAVVGFPLGASGLEAKAAETRIAVSHGATEIDMVIALGWVKTGRWKEAGSEIAAVVGAASGSAVKVILETAVLTPQEIELGCRAAMDAGAAFVKTSTGLHPAGGATVDAVALMRRIVGARTGVKASGGIRSEADALRMLAAGADRLGTSAAAGWSGLLGTGAPALATLLPSG